MIICAAIKFEVVRLETNRIDTLIICGLRHGDCYAIWNEMKNKFVVNKKTEGFVDENGVFFDRYEAYRKAMSIGQLSPSIELYKAANNEEELYSEDLY